MALTISKRTTTRLTRFPVGSAIGIRTRPAEKVITSLPDIAAGGPERAIVAFAIVA